jgi:transglutaminase-like putative cysteine protease
MKPQSISLDNLRWLMAAMALVLAPMFWHLPFWIPAFALLLGLWRHHIATHRLALPRLRILLPMTLTGTATIIASHGGSFGRNASVALLTLMLAMKLLETNSRRDAMLLVFLSWFLVITTFLFSQSLLLGAYMALPVMALTVTLVGISHPNGTLPAPLRLRLAARMLAQAIPVMLVLFLLFPRLSGPLWRAPGDATNAMTGLSEDMSPGSIIELTISDEIAFRAEFDGKIPDPSQRYWRGPVFWHYDGRTWRPGVLSKRLPREMLETEGKPVGYTVTLEPHNRHWLFALDMAASTPSEGRLTNDHRLVTQQPVHTRMRYATSSHLEYRLQPQPDEAIISQALQLPASSNPATRRLGQEWAQSGATPDAIVQKALTMFREQPYVYTLTPPPLGHDAVDEFLFSTRRGFCEHYAGSFVFLMRAAGVPARVVTGYQGGEVNPLGKYMIVRQSDAHAWAEVWLPQQGWVRIDPTAAVSPGRIELGMAASMPAGEPVPLLARGNHTWLHRIYLSVDAINNAWNQWVLGYNQQRQMQLLALFTGREISMRQLASLLMAAILVTMAAISWVILRDHHRRDAVQAAYMKFVRKLARAGVSRQPHEGPLDLARRAALQLPAKAGAIRRISMLYAGLRYGQKQSGLSVETLEKDVGEFRP